MTTKRNTTTDTPTTTIGLTFVNLDESEQETFRMWARTNWQPDTAPDPAWHPIVRDEWNKIKSYHQAETVAARRRAPNGFV